MARPKNEEGRAEIQRAATELFLKQGYDATSYADIAKATGRKRATVQSLFPKKSQLATNLINKLVYACQSYAADKGLAGSSPLDELYIIGQLYFSFLLSTARTRTFTFDVISDREATSNSLLFNEDWVRDFLQVSNAEAERCMDAFVLAMGGGYEIVYQRLTAGAPINVASLVDYIITSFLSCCGIEKLKRTQRGSAPEPLSEDVIASANAYLRKALVA